MRRIGADAKFDAGASLIGDPFGALDALEELGFRGILLRTLDEAFPTLDAAGIARFAREAERRGFFVRAGLGKINPYMTAELPRVRRLGDGSYLAGMERMIGICGEHGWREAWTATGGFKRELPAPFCFDRFRTDVAWQAQLDATRRFVEKLSPSLRRSGVRLNIETHEEITTHEILLLVEAAGDDVLGICLDPANLPVRGEAFGPGILRAAPHTHITHLRDAVLVRKSGSISRFLAPLGQGQIEWDKALVTLLSSNPDVDLMIEGIGGSRAEMTLSPDDPAWCAAHPDLDAAEIVELGRLADAGMAAPVPLGPDRRSDYVAFLSGSLASLRTHLHA
ncbi:MAG: sugar phosphate isomerase/epimerase [Rhizobiaceae bacterium]|nr:sugar phosphate isomerase/epimerase [Rhizobiaceae bacterium]